MLYRFRTPAVTDSNVAISMCFGNVLFFSCLLVWHAIDRMRFKRINNCRGQDCKKEKMEQQTSP